LQDIIKIQTVYRITNLHFLCKIYHSTASTRNLGFLTCELFVLQSSIQGGDVCVVMCVTKLGVDDPVYTLRCCYTLPVIKLNQLSYFENA